MHQYLNAVALVIPDYDAAIHYYTQVLGFELIEDRVVTPQKRFVRVGPVGRGPMGAGFVLAKAANTEQESRIGNQTGGRVFLFLHTDNFERDYRTYLSKGVKFVEQPRCEAYGTVVVFEDQYGNRWDLIEPK